MFNIFPKKKKHTKQKKKFAYIKQRPYKTNKHSTHNLQTNRQEKQTDNKHVKKDGGVNVRKVGKQLTSNQGRHLHKAEHGSCHALAFR